MGKMNVKKRKVRSSEQGNVQAMQFNHALGQHILKNPLIVQSLVEKVSMLVNQLGFLVTSKCGFPWKSSLYPCIMSIRKGIVIYVPWS